MQKSLVLTAAAASLLAAASSVLAAGTWVPANAPLGGSNFTIFGINNENVVTGSYTNSSGIGQGVVGPFDGSKYTSFDDGGGSTQPRGLNDKGWITGFDTGTLRQWERSPTGKLKDITWDGNPVDVPLAMGINKSGVFVGDHSNSSGIDVAAIGETYKYTSVIKPNYAARAIDDAGESAAHIPTAAASVTAT
jgi:hypothetical protein